MTQNNERVLSPHRHKVDGLAEILGIDYDDATSRLATDLVEMDQWFVDAIVERAQSAGFWSSVAYGRPTWDSFGDPTLREIRDFARLNGIPYGHTLYVGENIDPIFLPHDSSDQVSVDFLEAMKSARAAHGVSDEHVAEKMGVSVESVTKFSSSLDIRLSTLRRYALASFLRYDHFLK